MPHPLLEVFKKRLESSGFLVFNWIPCRGPSNSVTLHLPKPGAHLLLILLYSGDTLTIDRGLFVLVVLPSVPVLFLLLVCTVRLNGQCYNPSCGVKIMAWLNCVCQLSLQTR